MDTLASLYASVSGLWGKVARYLPLLSGAASVLGGAAQVLTEISRAQNAGQVLAIFQNLHHDPGVGMIAAGLAVLGLHANHQAVIAAVSAQTQAAPSNVSKP